MTSMMAAYEHHELPVLAVIGDRKEIREGWCRRQPVALHAPGSEPAGLHRDLAAHLAQDLEVVA